MEKLIQTNAVITSKASRQFLDGSEHIVVPVIALKEGILNDIFYSKKEIQTFAQAWNGVPVPVQHPEIHGVPVSANSPQFENTTNIGKFFNVSYDDGKLKGEIWINIEKANRLGYSDIIHHFDKGKMMEVSTGLYSETEHHDGVYGDTAYSLVAKNIRPDHLALLPNQIGACSIEDGCGAMRTHKETKACCNDCNDKAKSLVISSNKKDGGITENNGNIAVDSPKTEVDMTDKEKKVDSIIANEFTLFDKDDKDILMTFDVDVLEKLEPVVKEAKTDDVVVANTLSDDDMELFNRLKANEEQRIAKLRDDVVNAYEHLDKDVVAEMTVNAVEALAKGIKPRADYSARGGSEVKTHSVTTYKPTSILLADLNKDTKGA